MAALPPARDREGSGSLTGICAVMPRMHRTHKPCGWTAASKSEGEACGPGLMRRLGRGLLNNSAAPGVGGGSNAPPPLLSCTAKGSNTAPLPYYAH